MEARVTSGGGLGIELGVGSDLSVSAGGEGRIFGELSSNGALQAGLSADGELGGFVGCDVAVTGTCDITRLSFLFPLEPDIRDMNYGYVDNGTWKYEDPTQTYSDVYFLRGGHVYFITLGGEVGTRFRAAFIGIDPSKAVGDVPGERVVNLNSPKQYANTMYTPATDGYLVIGKDNVGKQGVRTYVYDAYLAWK